MLLGRPWPWKPLISCTEKYGAELSWRNILKWVFALLFVSSFALLFYSFVAGQRYPGTCTDVVAGVFPAAEEGNDHQLAVSEINETRVEDLFFGICASARMWPERRRYSEIWWQPVRTRGYVWFDSLPSAEAGAGPPHKVSPSASDKAAVRLARVLVESVRVAPPGVRWYVVGDDDTVFFVDNLAAALGQYDYRSMYYIGGVSESVEQDVMHSYNVAFGGGGFAVSRPLAEALVPIFAGCLRRYDSFYGSDERVAACVAELGVPLTRHQGFHQLDIQGDAYGLLAAHPIAPLVSLHHLDYLPPIFPAAATKLDAVRALFEASRADSGRTLQQAIGYGRGWSVSVSWGYTVQIYPFAIPPHELETAVQTFQTWRSRRGEPFTFKTRAWSSDPCRRPVIYFLYHEVVVMEGMGTVSLYKVHGRGRDGVGVDGCNDKEYYKEALKVEMVEVLAGKMAATAWTKVIWRSIYIFLTHFISYIRNYSFLYAT